MGDPDLPLDTGLQPETDAPPNPAVRLRLYVARSTPNSVRAEHNLSVVLEERRGAGAAGAWLEIIDVFAQPKRAITDGVIVTPTLIVMGSDKRIILMGDLSDKLQLESIIANLSA